MISWLYISSINNILFVLYETNNIYIKNTVGSIHNLVYSKIIEFVILVFILVYMLANNNYKYNRNLMIYGIIYGIVKSIQDIINCYQRETKKLNIEKTNYVTISIVESLSGSLNYNPNLLITSYLITSGSIIIDTANVNHWYQNKDYFNSAIPTDLEAPLLENDELADGMNNSFNRKYYIDKFSVLHLIIINLGDYIIKTEIPKEEIFINITIFYINSLVVSLIIIIMFLKKNLKKDIIYNLDVNDKREFVLRYFVTSTINTIYTISYYCSIILSPSITYTKSISKSWGLILLECIGCHNNIKNLNDLNFIGTLVISYSTIIFYLTCYYQN